MPLTQETDFVAILRTLRRHQVDFIVVGGVAAVLNGVPMMTFDLDLVHSRDDSNVTRTLAALGELRAIYRFQPERRLAPQASHLASPGHQLLLTCFGPLDLLGAIGRGRAFDDLLSHSSEITIEDGLAVRVLDLDTLIADKEATGGEKDLAALPLLRRTLVERRRKSE